MDISTALKQSFPSIQSLVSSKKPMKTLFSLFDHRSIDSLETKNADYQVDLSSKGQQFSKFLQMLENEDPDLTQEFILQLSRPKTEMVDNNQIPQPSLNNLTQFTPFLEKNPDSESVYWEMLLSSSGLKGDALDQEVDLVMQMDSMSSKVEYAVSLFHLHADKILFEEDPEEKVRRKKEEEEKERLRRELERREREEREEKRLSALQQQESYEENMQRIKEDIDKNMIHSLHFI